MSNPYSPTDQFEPAAKSTIGRYPVARPVWQLIFALALVLLWASASLAIPLAEYRDHVKKAIGALDELRDTELHPSSNRDAFVAANLRLARDELPRAVSVEWDGVTFKVDNSWFDDGLKDLEKVATSESERTLVLNQILERLHALQERLDEIAKTVSAPAPGKSEMRDRLAANLQRSEYAKTVKEEPALTRVVRQLVQWISSLFPKQRSLGQGGSALGSRLAQIFVLGIAVVAIAYVLWKFTPHFLSRRKAKKTSKPEARVVLGERLEADKSAADLLAEAEALARAGDLRGAIRRGYIALLIELADRKIISLAQHKTNRDYLRAVRGNQNLHQNMEVLTNNFEHHWYGLVPANENDWQVFRAGYKEAITVR